MAAGEAAVCRLSVEAKTQSTSCRVRTSSTATAWPAETLLCTWARGLPWGPRGSPREVPRPFLGHVSPCQAGRTGLRRGLGSALATCSLQKQCHPSHPEAVGASGLGCGWGSGWWERGGSEKLGSMFAS